MKTYIIILALFIVQLGNSQNIKKVERNLKKAIKQ